MSFTEEELAAAAWRRNLKLAEKLSREGERGRGPRRTDEWKAVGRRDCYRYEKESQSRWAEQERAKKSRRRAYSGEDGGDVDEFGRMRRPNRDGDKKSKITKDDVDSSHCRYSERGRSCSRSNSKDRWRRSKSKERMEHRWSRSRSRERVRDERYFESTDEDYQWDRKQPWANSTSQSSSRLESSWSHDKFDDIDRHPSPPRNTPGDYKPPSPSWHSRAGGVYLPVRKANETADGGA